MAEPPSKSSAPSDEILLFAALAGDHRAWNKLTERLDPYLVTIIRRRVRDLPEDIQSEVRQEVWAAVAGRGRRQPTHPNEPAKDYVRRFLSPAIDRVRSAYRAPGTRSRWRNEMREQEAPKVVELEFIEEHEDEASTAEFQRLEMRLEIEARLTSATTIVAMAAILMMRRGYKVSEAARATGLRRLALHRALRALGRRRVA